MKERCSDCGRAVYDQDPYHGSPCGTFCTECMEKHIEQCGVCKGEFEEDFDCVTDEERSNGPRRGE